MNSLVLLGTIFLVFVYSIFFILAISGVFYDLTCCFFVLFLYFLTSYNLLSNYSCLSDEIYHTQLNSFMQNMSSILIFSCSIFACHNIFLHILE